MVVTYRHTIISATNMQATAAHVFYIYDYYKV